MSNFYERYTAMCAKRGYTPSGAASAIGLSNAAANGWKKGKVPSDVNIAKLSALFGCTVADLTGEKENPATVTGSGMSNDYYDLTAENRALVDDLIAKLLKSQSVD